MLQRRSAIALLLAQSLACQPVPGTGGVGETTAAPDSPFVASAPGGDELVFPPAPELSPRRALPRHLAEDEHTGEAPTEVVWPERYEDGSFELAGQTLEIYFNRAIVPPAAGVEALTIEPAVPGTLHWSSETTLSFHADAPFDPDTEFTATLGELYDEGGQRVAEGWAGRFTATPQVWIAGKVIGYLPEAGKPRMVAVRPDGPPQVGPEIAPKVLFDQPVTLAQAAKLLDAEIDGKASRLALSFPRDDVFEGVRIEREHVVIARPIDRPGPGQTLTLRVRDDSGAELSRHAYEVAEPLAFETVECNDYYYEERECSYTAGTLSMDGNRFKLRFNNPIPESKQLARQVKVSPRVENLRVHSDSWRSDGAVWISGDFRPSTHYTVKVGRLEDDFGSRLGGPLRIAVETLPLTASVSMPEGQQVLDDEGSLAFPITTRNVEEAHVDLWEVEPRAEAWAEARRRLGARERPSGTPDLSIPVRPRAKRDEAVNTKVDLLDHLEPGKTYVAVLALDTTAFGAKPPAYPSWAMAARPPTALVTPHDANALAVHVHAGRDQTLVHVAGLGDGHPVAGARLLVDGERVPGVKTDDDGMAVLDRSLHAGVHVVEVESGAGRAVLAMGGDTLNEHELAPELAGGGEVLDDLRALVMSDRGVYRPGATVELKGIVQFRQDGKLRPVSTMPVGLRIHAPTGKQVFTTDGITGDLGSVVTRFRVPADAEIGRYRIELVAPMRDDAVLASYGVQVAEFEPPRFTVDVETSATAPDRLEASVLGRYLFGAAMEDAPVAWTLRREDAAMPAGPLPSKGFLFREQLGWWDDETEDAWVRSGEGQLDAKGRFSLSPQVELASDRGPQRFVLEAEVSDESHRAISGRSAVVLHPASRYAGLKLSDRWLDVGKAIPVEAGVVDTEGATVSGVPVELRLERLEWKRVRRPGAGGWADEDWHEVSEEVGRCTTSGTDTTGCRLVPEHSGSYRISAWIDGHRGGTQRLWAWGHGGATAMPSPGRRLEIVADKGRYRPGDTAQLMVSNPYPAATAILTVEQGGILHHETRTVTESAAHFSVPLGREHAPHAHATITLLPRDAKGLDRVDWKLGAIRLPVELGDNRLDVTVASDRDHYSPGEEVEIVVDVSQGGSAVADAEVALAVVDEGVLRLTNFHAPDPVPALYPGQGLELAVDDSRRLLAEQLRRSHVAGDGSGAGSHSLVATRKDFVRTALWKPQLRTDADGRVHVRLTLPDNLTRFRMMAVVTDGEGRGGVHEDDFEVRKPLMAIPAVPRFALVGDHLEAAVMVHNNQDHAERATVTMGKRSQEVEIAAGGRARVAFPLAPERTGTQTLRFAVADGSGAVRDRVEATLPVQAPGIDERPYLHGTFLGRQSIALEIPDEALNTSGGDDFVTVTVGENLWPELGERVEYLVGYPHGCVEQTTSSTLPLLAARDILPRLGLTRFSDEQLRDMIGAGVKRLSTMRTSEGGLAYWPGGYEANPFGTAYATLAIARARRLGIEAPAGMVDDMSEYMVHMLELDSLPHGYGVEVKAMLALALAELDALPPERADALWDTVEQQGVFGTATLALALARLPGQEDRVARLVDMVEGSFDEEGTLLHGRSDDDFQYYGSDQRTIAQSAIALQRLRPGSRLLPLLSAQLVHRTEGYTTHGTAYGLLALAERINDTEVEAHRQRALLDGDDLTPELSESMSLGPAARLYRIPLDQLRGRKAQLVLESESDRPQSFVISARWRRPGDGAGTRAATTTDHGPDLYRVITDAKGHAVDLDAIEPGRVLRVVLLARLPEDLPYSRRGYLAVTDRLPAGFEALQPDLWTVASVPELDEEHPLYEHLRWSGSPASHVELRDDRAQFYFDRVWGEWVHATYLMRATTPGQFTAPPAMAELMYEPDSAGYSQERSFTVKQ
ncbi:MAG: hypothetical protein H6712_16645 [Myxococcales bacterium]|nr:hypothetical protein [Myxococcales bacterium]